MALRIMLNAVPPKIPQTSNKAGGGVPSETVLRNPAVMLLMVSPKPKDPLCNAPVLVNGAAPAAGVGLVLVKLLLLGL